MRCKYCGKKKENESDLELIKIGFNINFCQCTQESIEAAGEVKWHAELLAAADLALQSCPNDKRLAKDAKRYYRRWQEARVVAGDTAIL